MDISFQSSNLLHGDTEFVRHRIIGSPNSGRHYLDVDAKLLFDHIRTLSNEASDFLFFATAVYGADKMAVRAKHAEDRWTRSLNLEIPVLEVERWTAAKSALEESIGFLTGDLWNFTFVKSNRRPFGRRTNRIKPLKGVASAPTVSLLSGGLDSFAGAIKFLEDEPRSPLILASHYDGKVSGPKSDQGNVIQALMKHYPRRIQHIRLRVGVGDMGAKGDEPASEFETSFRSRSLVFLAVAFAVASAVKKPPQIAIPENGAIALNFPLNPSRRGSCSTRTVHPHFLKLLQVALERIGLTNDIINPFQFLTKGQVNECVSEYPAFSSAYKLTNSCAKSGHNFSWENRLASACGRCVPCLFRRASLHRIQIDNETFGNEVLKVYSGRDALPDDFRSLLDLVRQNPDEKSIMRGLIANGSLPAIQLPEYAALVARMIGEVRQWLSDKAPKSVKTIAAIN